MSFEVKSEAKRMLRRDIVKHGAADVEGLKPYFPAYMGYSFAQSEMDKWIRGMDRGLRFETPPKHPRLVNRFCVGADPEFVFGAERKVMQDVNGRGEVVGSMFTSVTAAEMGLQTGLAFGADLNGRLVELRVHPSRFVLEGLGSVLDTLRWLAAFYPEVTRYAWIAGGWQFNDGLGGHVHFGRKRPTTATEAKALDVVWTHLLQLGTYSVKEADARQRGDAHGQRYGRPYAEDPGHAVRPQSHGYEYRTFPSWLDSPQAAYLTMVLAKLTVVDPELMPTGTGRGSQTTLRQRVLNLLRYYQGRDDDASMCLAMVRRAWPQFMGGDFKSRWGITGELKAPDGVRIIPRTIKPEQQSLSELMGLVLLGRQIPARLPEASWTPTSLPDTGQWMMSGLRTDRQIGLGEIAGDLVCDKRCPVMLVAGGSEGMYISKGISALLLKNWREELQTRLGKLKLPPIGTQQRDGSKEHINVGTYLRAEAVPLVRKILLCGVLPLWRLKDFKATSFDEWRAATAERMKQPEGKVLGKVIYEERL